MSSMTERDTTRLSFLMASLVSSPDLASRFVERVLSDEQAGTFASVVKAVRTSIEQATPNGPPTRTTLRKVAEELISENSDQKKTAGRLLAAALESAPR